MTAKKKKYYVVWVGVEPGIYDSWTECQLQIKSYPGARYKSYDSLDAATAAYRGDPAQQLDLVRAIARRTPPRAPKPPLHTAQERPLYGVAVDGACSGNPGKMEYRAVDIASGRQIFLRGADGSLSGTNNIAEYLAIIHIAALLARNGDSTTPIYSDSRTAQSWIRRRHSKSLLQRTPATALTLDLLERADAWIATHSIPNPIIKWDTDAWGEIPADFGRKS